MHAGLPVWKISITNRDRPQVFDFLETKTAQLFVKRLGFKKALERLADGGDARGQLFVRGSKFWLARVRRNGVIKDDMGTALYVRDET